MLNYFRPKARHIHTIGKDLIKDDFSALIELVKNSYDADSESVNIIFNNLDGNKIEIIVQDKGHGMSEQILRNNWLVPSTDNKKTNITSPKGRLLQGQKGIGRYATAVLGDILNLESTISSGITSYISLDWESFNQDKFLDEIIINIETKKTGKEPGTKIQIIGNEEKLLLWKRENIQNKLKLELEKLKPPFDTNNTFKINLDFFGNNIELDNGSLAEEYFDYKIKGEVMNNGTATITYINADTKKEETFIKEIDIVGKDDDIKGEHKYPGKIKFSLQVLDRDAGRERELISKSFGRVNYNRGEIKSYYDKFSGVSIYRGDFRIRPFGERNYDWLNLNIRRVNNPSLRISTNQLIGYISIEDENKSNLIEASSREGLKENPHFLGLITEIRDLLSELEDRRWKYRGEVGLREKKEKEVNIELEVDRLEKIIDVINDEKSRKYAVDEVKNLGKKFQKEKDRLENIITQYEGQVTLGKLLSITFHETSKPTKFMRENIKNVEYYISEIEKNLIGGLGEFGEKLLHTLKGYSINAKIVSDFMYKNLQPLIKGKEKANFYYLHQVVNQSKSVFESILLANNITIDIDIEKNIQVYGYEKDYIVAFTNFIDNSIYWLNEVQKDNKIISISSEIQQDVLNIYFKDNGFGIENVEDFDDIIEPGFSRKPGGSGLGLSIAGEVLEGNNVQMKILGKEENFNFIIKLTVIKWKL